MANILVDPVLVTTTEDDASKEAVEDWLTNLDIWLKEALASTHTWLHCVEATYQLINGGRFPNFSLLRAWQQKYRLDINIRQIDKRVNEFFNNEEFDLGGKLEKLGYLIELDKISIAIYPEQFFTRWLNLIQDEMSLLLAVACACKQMGEPVACSLSIATLALAESKEVEISAIITYSIPEFDWDANDKITQAFPLLFTPDDIPPLDVITLWDLGEAGIREAIEQYYREEWQSTVPNPIEYRIGLRFIESVNNAHLNNDEVLLSKIIRFAAAVIAGEAQNLNCNLRHLRVSEAANSPQRTRSSDNAKAWRLTLVDRGVGWRMHYWQISTSEGSVIEFANVLKKHDLEEIY